MESYPPAYSYPDSGNSSPRSHDVDFDNAPPTSWEDHPISSSTTFPPSYKVKFMVSYGGKIQPRPHDNLLAYVGGETKILAVDCSVKFATMYTKLATLFSPTTDASPSAGFTVKYQLPGEDLDALISVTNDDDLEHMMSEYDRMLRGSIKSVRLRLFLFNEVHQQWPNSSGVGSAFSSVESETGKFGGEPETGPNRSNKSVDTLISNQPQQQPLRQQNEVVLEPPPAPRVVTQTEQSKVDFLFGLEKGPAHVPGPVAVQVDPAMELGRLQLREQQHQQQLQQQQSTMYYQRNDENFGDQYQRTSAPANVPAKISTQTPSGYWQQVEHHQLQQPPQQQQHHQQYQLQQPPQQQQQQQHQQHQYQPQQPPQLQHQQQQQQQPVYMMQVPPQGSVYNGSMMQGQIQANQGYYRPMYSTPAAVPATVPAMNTAAHVRSGVAGETTGYQQVAAGRQVYSTMAPQAVGLVAPPYPGMKAATTVVASGGEMRSLGDGKGVQKGVSSTASL